MASATSATVTPLPSPASSALFNPLTLGPSLTLSHRIVLAPLTRLRASKSHTPTPLATQYYTQRARPVPGTLLITEATFVSPQSGGIPHVPGIWNDAQITAWKEIADAVHKEGSFIFMQIWGLGRAAYPGALKSEDETFEYVSSSDVPLSDRPEGDPKPRALSEEEIKEYVKWFGQAAHNAVHEAGLDGVEIHAAHGYLIDQFLQDTSNKRDDKYGGSVENRTRFALEIVDEVVRRVGAERVGIRFSPWNLYGDMRMADPIPTFSHLVSSIAAKHPHFAYIHSPEPRVSNATDRTPEEFAGESNDFLRRIWASGPGAEKRVYISAGGYTAQTAVEAVERAEREGRRELVAFGRQYISNPDLPLRIKHNIPFSPCNRALFYGPQVPEGYTDYTIAVIPTEEQGEIQTEASVVAAESGRASHLPAKKAVAGASSH